MQVVSESFWANTPHKNVSSALMFRHLILLWAGRLVFHTVICNQWICCAGSCFDSLLVRWLVFIFSPWRDIANVSNNPAQ
jgi:hypothetical protein